MTETVPQIATLPSVRPMSSARLVKESPRASGPGHEALPIVTAATSANLEVRVPSAEMDTIRAFAFADCPIAVRGVVWRNAAVAQLSTWNAARDISFSACTTPARLIDVRAVGATAVVLTFSRALDPGSVNAAEFSLAPTGTIAQASVDADVVTLTTAAPLPDGTYTVNVPGTVLDVLGIAVGPVRGEFAVGDAALDLEISEIDADTHGTDAAEFVAIRNYGADAIDLAGFTLVRVNRFGAVYGETALSGSIAGGEEIVIGNVAGADFSFGGATNQLINGPDASVALVSADNNVVDGIIYDANISSQSFDFGGETLTIDEATFDFDTENTTLCRPIPKAPFTRCL